MAKIKNPSSSLLLLLSFLLLFSHLLAISDDAPVMWDLAKSLISTPSNWKPGSDPCDPEWTGINCDSGRVVAINLASKSLSGELPDGLNKLSSLKTLSLQKNQIGGALPSLSNLSTLQEIYLGFNAFTSISPTFFTGLSSLQNVSLDNNPFLPWSIPEDLAESSSLIGFFAMKANVVGSIPDFFGRLPNFQSLRLSYNNLTGGLPGSFAGSTIQNLLLNNQQSDEKLTGEIKVLGSMTQLNVVWLQSNSFTGPIPDLSNCTSLTDLALRDNQLTGVVPPLLTSHPTLRNVTLSNNELQGPLPSFPPGVSADVDQGNSYCKDTIGPCDPIVTVLLSVAGALGYPKALADSWQGNDPCSRKWTFVTCDAQGKNVIVLNFAKQNFVGIISPDIANLTALQKLVLSDNNLTGMIPDSLTGLNQLQLLDVTNNNLSGKVPKFAQLVDLKLSGNPLLGSDSKDGGGGGSPGSDTGGKNGSSPGGSGSQSGGSHSFSVGVIVGIIVAVVVLIGCFASLLYYHRRNHKPKFGRVQAETPPNEPEIVKIGMVGINVNGGAVNELYSHSSAGNGNTDMIQTQGMWMSIQALRKATNNFSEDNILGRGGFGVVYRGDHNETLIAVKRNESDKMGQKGMVEFLAEIEVLTKVRHRHLVALLGYCEDGYERLLVYEYMSEGTLGQHLFDLNKSGYSVLNWKQRLIIALDVARGIEYLHGLAQESFIHRDLKPSNILLDKDLRAKVSDFGLVKKSANTDKSMMTRLAGTFGYLAPEYAITGKVTTKIDVYAFGVILMELITGRKVLDESLPEEEAHLVTVFRRNLLNKDRFLKSVDPALDLDEEACSTMFEVAELARHCTAREPHQRPDMGHVVNLLGPLVDQWKPSCYDEEDNDDDSNMSLNQRVEKWRLDDVTSTTETGYSSYKGSLENTHGGLSIRRD